MFLMSCQECEHSVNVIFVETALDSGRKILDIYLGFRHFSLSVDGNERNSLLIGVIELFLEF